MILSSRANEENLKIIQNNNNICSVTSHKYLWVTIDEILRLDVHVNKISTNVSESIRDIRRVSNIMPENLFNSVYYLSFIFTHHVCILGR